jgi:hypothetical protein
MVETQVRKPVRRKTTNDKTLLQIPPDMVNPARLIALHIIDLQAKGNRKPCMAPVKPMQGQSLRQKAKGPTPIGGF